MEANDNYQLIKEVMVSINIDSMQKEADMLEVLNKD